RLEILAIELLDLDRPCAEQAPAQHHHVLARQQRRLVLDLVEERARLLAQRRERLRREREDDGRSWDGSPTVMCERAQRGPPLRTRDARSIEVLRFIEDDDGTLATLEQLEQLEPELEPRVGVLPIRRRVGLVDEIERAEDLEDEVPVELGVRDVAEHELR